MIRYRKIYDSGGSMEAGASTKVSKLGALTGAFTGVASFAGTAADALNPPDQYGRQGVATNVLKNVGAMASTGAAFGPVGAGVGAVLGAGLGLIQARKQQEEARKQIAINNDRLRKVQLDSYAARAAADPTISTGVKGQDYFANGGGLFSDFIRYKAKGGSLSRLSSDSVAVSGNSHAQGGVKLNTGDEVEGGESIKGDYVFSKKLGFAQLHKPLAKAIGKLEQRPVTKTTLTSLANLRKREDALMLVQELVRKEYNLD